MRVMRMTYTARGTAIRLPFGEGTAGGADGACTAGGTCAGATIDQTALHVIVARAARGVGVRTRGVRMMRMVRMVVVRVRMMRMVRMVVVRRIAASIRVGTTCADATRRAAILHLTPSPQMTTAVVVHPILFDVLRPSAPAAVFPSVSVKWSSWVGIGLELAGADEVKDGAAMARGRGRIRRRRRWWWRVVDVRRVRMVAVRREAVRSVAVR